ncbi:MAG: leucine--tRNA ligase [Candidatus Altiarchaeota archaeon]
MKSEDASFKEIEEKWLSRWESESAFESDPDEKKESFYLTVAYPYPSGTMHIGHARTYTVPDVICRFKRMQGFNVLFPMAWHVTGTPIIGAVQRLKDGEEKQIKIMREVYGLTDAELKEMTDPMGYAQYFIKNHYRKYMKKLGYSIDWRRQFTTNDKNYNQFITWQYKTLHSRGLLKEGLHPVKYCTVEKNPVTTHDLLEGTEAEIQEFTLLKFQFGKELIIAATLRPETVFGQTNMWVNPKITYVKADVEGESWIISQECADKLAFQDRKVKIKGNIKGTELIGKSCTAPGIDRVIPILPSDFPDPDIGTGLVTSVPSDAPYDYIALLDLQKSKSLCEKHGLNWEDIKKIEVIPIIKTEEYGDYAAIEIVKKMGIKNQLDTEKLEEATKIIYKAGFHAGVMNENCGAYAKMAVARAKDKVKQWLIDEGKASSMKEFSEKVTCRCGAKVVVAMAESWFLSYGNEDWKEMVRGAIANLSCIPERTKQDYENTVDWLREWPCIRNYGLGTRLPFDDRFMIEPLSDSTIYMAYYTISHLIKDLKPEQLPIEFFNFVFRNEGTIEEVEKATGIKKEKLTEIKDSFDYWYPQNWRCSALELIQNHLTFMLYHHVALFPFDKWPKGIASFGMGLMNGEKMSSSKGNVVIVKDAVEKYGADVVRLFLMANAEPWQDFDWRDNLVENTGRKLNQFSSLVEKFKLKKVTKKEFSDLDLWLQSKFNRVIKEVTESLEQFQTRKAIQVGFYGLLGDVNWYLRRTSSPNEALLNELAHTWVRLMTPFTPFICEELWEKLGSSGFVSNAPYPKADEKKINLKDEAKEDFVLATREDLQNILNVIKSKPKKVHLYLSADWKRKVYKYIIEGKQIKDAMADPEIKEHGKDAAKLMQTRKDQIPKTILSKAQEEKALSDAKDFFEKEFPLKFQIQAKPSYDPENKARFALPGKPGIYME